MSSMILNSNQTNMAAAIHGYHPPLSLNSPPKPKPPPLHISTNPTDINPFQLQKLYTQCNHSSHRFPKINPSTGLVEPVEIKKLQTAISYSSIVVSVYAKNQENGSSISRMMGIGGVWTESLISVTPENGRLVGFGRAVSDMGLTASIYDLMVIPHLRRRGIGRMIVQRILRMLTRIEVYDIAALCSDKERPFFKACGFGDDILGSTTMMYSRTASVYSDDNQVVDAGRKLLWIPPIRQNCLISSLSDR